MNSGKILLLEFPQSFLIIKLLKFQLLLDELYVILAIVTQLNQLTIQGEIN